VRRPASIHAVPLAQDRRLNAEEGDNRRFARATTMPHVNISIRAWWRALTGVCVALACALASASPLVLSDDASLVDAWPALTMLSDPTHALDAEGARARAGAFEVPRGPRASLGSRRDALWFRIPVDVPPGANGRWVLEVDYATLNHVDVHVFTGGRLVQHAALGSAIPFAERAMPSRAHAVTLELEPGRAHEVFVRVDTKTSVVVPISFVKPTAFHAREASAQMLQGLMAGVGLCLLVYSLAQWVSLRDRMFVYYAIMTCGTTVFFLGQYGLAPQYLWPHSAWMAMNFTPLPALVGLTGLAPFIGRALKVDEWSRTAARALNGVGLVAVAVAAAFLLGAIDYRVMQLGATILGPLPMAIAIAAGWVRWRQGDRAAPYFLLGWTAYALGALMMVGLLRGLLPANTLTQHGFQFATMFEMLMWMLVLGVRMDEIRDAAQRAHLERDALRSMAFTDALTGLPNRRGLNEVLRHELGACAPERMVALFLLDLDGFKAINDRLGHDAGDELLVHVAKRLHALLRASDVVARLGGDEFVIMAGGLPGDAEAQRLGRKLIEGFREPFDVAGQRCLVGLTVGYALSPLDGRDSATLLKLADAAMYAGKQAGRNCVRRGEAAADWAAA
jgi:diguanylate cyclase (GGDEF)-like protein